MPYNATGYDGKNWPTDRVVYGAALSDLTMSDGTLTPGFFPGINDYTVSVANHVERVSVIPTAHDTETITVNDISVNSGAASGDVELEAGKITEITVIAKNSDADSRTYTIHVMRTAPDMIPVTGVVLDPATLTLYTNRAPDHALLAAEIQPGNATNQAVVWNSSAPDIAAVDSSGRVKAVSPGSTVITVTTVDGGRKASCAVTVKKGGSSGDSGNDGGNGSGDSGNEGSGSDSTSEDSPSYIHRILTDKVTGVTVAGNQINEYAVLTVKPAVLHPIGDAGCDILRAAQGAGRVLSLYDISLSHGFYGNVTVSIPVEDRDGQTMTLVRCVGGNLTLSNATADRGMVTVTVDSLSPFVLLNDVYTLESLAAPQVPAPAALAPDSDRARSHRVKKGDTLSALAQRYGCTVAEIAAANPIIQNPDFILPGWLLEIP